jgi:predicted PurR-regulated permease PerM
MDRRLLVTLLTFTGLIAGLYLIFTILTPFLSAIGWAIVIAIATYPLYRRLQQRLPSRTNLSAALMTAAVFLVILVPTTVVLSLLVKEAVRAERALVALLERDAVGGLDQILQHPVLVPWIEHVKGWAGMAGVDIREAATNTARTVLAWLATNFGAVIKNLFLFLFQLFVIVVALFFVYRDGARAERAFWAALPMSEGAKKRVRDTTGNVVSAVVSGVLVTAAVQAAVASLAYWFCGLPSVVLLGAITFLAAFIPVVGTALVWLPAAAYLLLTGETTYGIVLLVWGAAVVSSIDSVLRPVLISGGTGLPLSLMMLGALGGLLAFGFFGLVIGPLALAVFLLGLDAWARLHQSPALPVRRARRTTR